MFFDTESPTTHELPPPQPRMLHIYKDGLTYRHLRVIDSDKITPLYTVTANNGTIFSSKPQMQIAHAYSPTAPFATAKFHVWTSKISLSISNRPVQLTPTGILSRSHTFASVTGVTLKWEITGLVMGVGLTLVNEEKQWIAKFHDSTFAMGKEGKIELADEAIAQEFVDEIVVTALAMVVYQRRNRNSSVV